MAKLNFFFLSKIFIFILVVGLLLFVSPNSILAQEGSLGGSFGGDGGGGDKSAYDGTNGGDGSSFNDDFSGGDFSGGDNSFDDYSDSTSGDDNTSNFSEVSQEFGLGNEAGVESNPGAPAPLSNQNHTIDTIGATATADSSDEGYQCENVNCNEPVLTGYTYCIGSQPAVRLNWTADTTNTSSWHVIRAEEPNPSFAQIVSRPSNHQPYYIDEGRTPNQIYYYGVFYSNSGNQTLYNARTPLSNILAVYTPSCAPVVTPVCSDTNPATIEDFSVSWYNNNPTAFGYKLYRGINDDVLSRAYLPPDHAASVNNYTDATVDEGNSYNYWFKSFYTVYHEPYQEVTGTDENGNPTGFIDYPGYYEDIESAFSGMSSSFTPKACTEPVQTLPIINLSLTTPLGTFTDQDLPASVKEGEAVVLNWTIQNATSATASSLPQIAQWQGSVNPVSGSVNIPTGTVGTYVFSLSATDGANTEVRSIQLNINLQRAPFIQTTGGDVHTNEDIYISPP